MKLVQNAKNDVSTQDFLESIRREMRRENYQLSKKHCARMPLGSAKVPLGSANVGRLTDLGSLGAIFYETGK